MQKSPAAKNLYFIVHVEINYLNKSPATERSKNVISMQNSKSAVSAPCGSCLLKLMLKFCLHWISYVRRLPTTWPSVAAEAENKCMQIYGARGAPANAE